MVKIRSFSDILVSEGKFSIGNRHMGTPETRPVSVQIEAVSNAIAKILRRIQRLEHVKATQWPMMDSEAKANWARDLKRAHGFLNAKKATWEMLNFEKHNPQFNRNSVMRRKVFVSEKGKTVDVHEVNPALLGKVKREVDTLVRRDHAMRDKLYVDVQDDGTFAVMQGDKIIRPGFKYESYAQNWINQKKFNIENRQGKKR